MSLGWSRSQQKKAVIPQLGFLKQLLNEGTIDKGVHRDKDPTRRPEKLARAGSHYHSWADRSEEGRWWSWSLVGSCGHLKTTGGELWSLGKADSTRPGA